MRIAFNGQRLAGQPFGVGRYLEYLLRYWDKQLRDGEEMTVFLRQPPPVWLTELGPRIRTALLESNRHRSWRARRDRAGSCLYDRT